MPIVVNSNPTATTASFNLSQANDALRKSLARLSSGNRIVNSSDDAGGLAVAYKLDSQLNRIEAVRQNVQNGMSYLQVQDGALGIIGEIVDRMSELRAMAQDVTKNEGDVENYSKEFIELQRQLGEVYREKFNGVSLFARSDAAPVATPKRPPLNKQSDVTDDQGKTFNKFSRTLYTHESGDEADGSVSIGVINLQYVLALGKLDTTYAKDKTDPENPQPFSGTYGSKLNESANLGNVGATNKSSQMKGLDGWSDVFNSEGYLNSILYVSVGTFTDIIERVADVRAENGAEQNRLQKVEDLLTTNMVNLEAAHGRIMDADIALESTRMARHNVLVQSSAAMVAQANQLSNIALTILNG